MGIAGAVGLSTMAGACMELEEAPPPALMSIEPARAYSDQSTRVLLRGKNLLPSIDLDLNDSTRSIGEEGWSGFVGAGLARVDLRDIRWRSTDLLEATLLPGLPVAEAPYPVTVVDPRGRSATLAVGFDSLGADRIAPALSILQPEQSAPLAPGMNFTLRLEALDAESGSVTRLFYIVRANGITIAQDNCAVLPKPTATSCTVSIPIPGNLAGGSVLEIAARAEDASVAVNSSEVTMQFVLAAPVSVTGISPQRGGERGGNEIAIRGEGFVPGTKVYLDGIPIAPDGGRRIDMENIVGRTPPHAVGIVDLEVRAPTGQAILTRAFVYAETPTISTVVPAQSPQRGAYPLLIRGKNFNPTTRVLFGDRLTTAVILPAQRFVDEETISGYSPPGMGTAAVWVLDPALGATPWTDRFTWSPEIAPTIEIPDSLGASNQ